MKDNIDYTQFPKEALFGLIEYYKQKCDCWERLAETYKHMYENERRINNEIYNQK